MYWDSKLVRETGRGIKNTFGDNTVLGHAGGVLQSEAQKNVNDPDAGIMKAGAVAAMIFGGMAAGGEGSAGAGTAGGAGSAGGARTVCMSAAGGAGGGAGAFP
jgi:hypothetical protein